MTPQPPLTLRSGLKAQGGIRTGKKAKVPLEGFRGEEIEE